MSIGTTHKLNKGISAQACKNFGHVNRKNAQYFRALTGNLTWQATYERLMAVRFYGEGVMTETTKTKAVAKASAVKETKASTAKAAVKPAVAKAAPAKAAEPKAAAPKAKPTSGKPKAAVVKATGSDGTLMMELSAEAVARKAYEIFVREGHQHGSDQDHWFRAESELRGNPT
jgi:hypothetical protein